MSVEGASFLGGSGAMLPRKIFKNIESLKQPFLALEGSFQQFLTDPENR